MGYKLQDKAKQTPRQRLFTNEFKKGDRVAIIRHEHGWSDGEIEGIITSISENSCVVKCLDKEFFGEYYINHPRDIYKVE